MGSCCTKPPEADDTPLVKACLANNADAARKDGAFELTVASAPSEAAAASERATLPHDLELGRAHYELMQRNLESLAYRGKVACTAWLTNHSERNKALVGIQGLTAALITQLELKAHLSRWLAAKRRHGSTIEREFYAGMTEAQLVQRLLVERPLTFFERGDTYLLRSGEQGKGAMEIERGEHSWKGSRFQHVGTDLENDADQPPCLRLSRTLSYDEMAISALLSVGTATFFKDDGARDDPISDPERFVWEGVCVN